MSNKTSFVSYSKIWQVSYPIIIGGLAQNIVNVTDTAFLSHLGIVEVGAAGNAGILYYVFVMIGMGFTLGSQILIARKNGAELFKDIGNIFHQALWFVLGLTIASFLFMQLAAPKIFQLLTASQDIFEASMKYLNYRSFGVGFAYLGFLCVAFFTGITETKVLIRVTITQALINVILDYALIFGHFGLPELKIEGAAIASLISEMVAFVMYVFIIRSYVKSGKHQLFAETRFDFQQLKTNVVVSFPIMLQHLLAITTWLSFFMIIEQLGETELAVSHIIRSIYMVLMIPLFGFSSATSTLVSNLIGGQQSDQVMLLVKRIILLCLSACIVFIPINFIIPEWSINVYTSDSLLVEMGVPVLKIISLAMLLFSIAYISFSAVIGTANTKITLLIEIFSISTYLISAYYFAIILESSLTEVWCSEFVYFFVMGAFSLLYLKFGNWKSIKI